MRGLSTALKTRRQACLKKKRGQALARHMGASCRQFPRRTILTCEKLPRLRVVWKRLRRRVKFQTAVPKRGDVPEMANDRTLMSGLHRSGYRPFPLEGLSETPRVGHIKFGTFVFHGIAFLGKEGPSAAVETAGSAGTAVAAAAVCRSAWQDMISMAILPPAIVLRSFSHVSGLKFA